jgi:hypothetical protein
VKERSNLTSLRINAAQVRAFLQIALPTGQREIVGGIRTTVLAGDDMFDVKRTPERNLWDTTVLTTMAGAVAHLGGELVHVGC